MVLAKVLIVECKLKVLVCHFPKKITMKSAHGRALATEAYPISSWGSLYTIPVVLCALCPLSQFYTSVKWKKQCTARCSFWSPDYRVW